MSFNNEVNFKLMLFQLLYCADVIKIECSSPITLFCTTKYTFITLLFVNKSDF